MGGPHQPVNLKQTSRLPQENWAQTTKRQVRADQGTVQWQNSSPPLGSLLLALTTHHPTPFSVRKDAEMSGVECY